MSRVSFITESTQALPDSVLDITVEEGKTILETARLAGVLIESPCNGNGSCGKCKVRIDTVKTGNEEVLACRYTIKDDIKIFVKDSAEENKSLRIVSRGKDFKYEIKPFITKQFRNGKTEVYGGGKLLGLEAGDSSTALYGLAVDIGTTTLVLSLIDLTKGETLACESALNPQAAYAQDVLGRIHFSSKEGGLETLYRALTDELKKIISSLAEQAGIKKENIYEAVYSGNTTMLHLACNIDPHSLGQFPYVSQITGAEHISASVLEISPFGLIWLPPVISAYVGADISSGILASRLGEKKGVTVFIDVGTNGEIVLARNGAMAASSTAAGPAFEGMNISCGMRAGRGAIESFRMEGERFSCNVIGGGKAAGICGSGLLDITAELVRTGIVGKNGRLLYEDKKVFPISADVYLAQKDVRQVQLAKGAIRCGIEMLLSRFDLKAVDVDTVEIAGSFGYHLNEASLLTIGLIPPEFRGKVQFVGNTSMSGAAAFLLNSSFRSETSAWVKEIEAVELAGDKGFEKTFISFLGF
jgi:uncharacterized 2Fe-2S/4Fe-4S cluster protein (DUF4445 family)